MRTLVLWWQIPVLLVCFILCTSVPSLAQSTPEIIFDSGVPLAPNVTPVIVLSGSNFEMGYQWYQQLVQVYGSWILEGKVPGEKEYKRLDLRFRYKGYAFTEEDTKALKAYESYIKQHAPEMIDIFRGMAAGATDAGIPITYSEVLAQWHGSPQYWVKRSGSGTPPGGESKNSQSDDDCAGFAAWGKATSDGRLVCGVSPDQEVGFDVVIMAFPKEGGNNFMISPYNAMGGGGSITSVPKLGGAALNSKGLTYLFAADVASKSRAEYKYGLTEQITTIHTLRFANNADEALKMLLELPNGDDHAGGMWADTGGKAFYVESRENPTIVRRPGYLGEVDFIYATNNALHRESGKGEGGGTYYFTHGGWAGPSTQGLASVSRNLGLWNMLHYYNGFVNPEFAKMMFRFAGDPNPGSPTLELGVGEAKAGSYDQMLSKVSLRKKIGGLHNDRVFVMIPDAGEFYVCQGRAGRIADPAVGRAPYTIDPTYSFYKLKLDANSIKVAEMAEEQAADDLIRAHQKLMKLTYADPAYAPLIKIFNRAATERRKGVYYKDYAENTTGNEAVYNWGRTIRSFARCQAYAQQVYEALVPPATTPEDLGYKPWGYWIKAIK